MPVEKCVLSHFLKSESIVGQMSRESKDPSVRVAEDTAQLKSLRINNSTVKSSVKKQRQGH